MKRYCFALDLQDDPELIEEYKGYHGEKIWPEVLDAALDHGVVSEEIYLAGNRLFMILQTRDDFSLDAKRAADSSNPRMQEWEKLMWRFQKALPFAKPGEKWVAMEKIFEVK